MAKYISQRIKNEPIDKHDGDLNIVFCNKYGYHVNIPVPDKQDDVPKAMDKLRNSKYITTNEKSMENTRRLYEKNQIQSGFVIFNNYMYIEDGRWQLVVNSSIYDIVNKFTYLRASTFPCYWLQIYSRLILEGYKIIHDESRYDDILVELYGDNYNENSDCVERYKSYKQYSEVVKETSFYCMHIFILQKYLVSAYVSDKVNYMCGILSRVIDVNGSDNMQDRLIEKLRSYDITKTCNICNADDLYIYIPDNCKEKLTSYLEKTKNEHTNENDPKHLLKYAYVKPVNEHPVCFFCFEKNINP